MADRKSKGQWVMTKKKSLSIIYLFLIAFVLSLCLFRGVKASERTFTVKLPKLYYEYDSKGVKPPVTVYLDGKLVEDDYGVVYSYNTYPGVATATVIGDNDSKYEGIIGSTFFLIRPSQVTLKNVTARDGRVTGYYNLVSRASGYMMQLSKTEDFKTVYKQKTVDSVYSSNITIKDIPEGTYYVRVKALRLAESNLVSSRYVHGNWSSVEKIVVKSAYMTTGKNDLNVKLDKYYVQYTGANVQPTFKVYYEGKLLPETEYYADFYDQKNPGVATVYVQGKGKAYGLHGVAYYKVIPEPVTIRFIKGLPDYLNLGWTVSRNTDGYIIQISTSSDFKTYKQKTVYNTDEIQTIYNWKNLKPGTYYARVRAFKKNAAHPSLSGNFACSEWSMIKSATLGTSDHENTKKGDGNLDVVMLRSKHPYTGQEIKAPMNVYYNSKMLKRSDYDIEYSFNTRPGLARVRVVGKGDYQGCYGNTVFRILPMESTIKWISKSDVLKTTLEWSKSDYCNGYMIQFSKTSNFENIAFQNTIYDCNITSRTYNTIDYTIKPGTYYVRLKPFANAPDPSLSGTRAYPDHWSNVVQTTIAIGGDACVKDSLHVLEGYYGGTVSLNGHYEKAIEQELIRLLNDYRVQNGRARLTVLPYLTNASEIRAAETSYFNGCYHKRIDGRSWTTVAPDLHGENIAGYWKFDGVVKGIMDQWIKSPGHNANMLKSSHYAVGIGVFAKKTDKGYYYYAVQLFK